MSYFIKIKVYLYVQHLFVLVKYHTKKSTDPLNYKTQALELWSDPLNFLPKIFDPLNFCQKETDPLNFLPFFAIP